MPGGIPFILTEDHRKECRRLIAEAEELRRQDRQSYACRVAVCFGSFGFLAGMCLVLAVFTWV